METELGIQQMTCRLILPNYMKIPEFAWENA